MIDIAIRNGRQHLASLQRSMRTADPDLNALAVCFDVLAARSEATTAQAEALELARARIGELEAENDSLRSSEAWAIGLLNSAEDALRAISGQAVCVGMDGDEGNTRMLKNIHDIAEAHLSLDRALLSPVQTKEGEG